ncbi:MAG: glycosyltransferase [Saprospiraceae bacterium]|nr:glycosyltransferase [Saprospiraceae bacterium]MBK8297671.1 glycosyltransferase [Saprospiraceae bacterium]
MKIVIAINSKIPVNLYGGTERVIWYLGKELSQMGHTISYLAPEGSHCNFAKIIPLLKSRSIQEQIPRDTDLVHFHFSSEEIDQIKTPFLITMHGNTNDQKPLHSNTVFVSSNHAARFGSSCYVYNGLDWNDYPLPNFKKERSYFHFLGKAAWRIKNVQGAIDIILATPKEKLKVLGGYRFNFKMGLRFTFSPRILFYGMVGGTLKTNLLNESKGLIFPVRWHEPFGLAIIESLYYGCPVFGTPYGSLPELIPKDFGYLSNQKNKLVDAILNSTDYSSEACHEYALNSFNSRKMSLAYLEKYKMILDRQDLNLNQPILQEIQKQKFLEWLD